MKHCFGEQCKICLDLFLCEEFWGDSCDED